MNRRNPMDTSRNSSADAAAKKDSRVVGHTVVLGPTAAGKTVNDLLRVTSHGLHLIRKKPASGQWDDGGQAWA